LRLNRSRPWFAEWHAFCSISLSNQLSGFNCFNLTQYNKQ
jgi:hypothetical protein